MEKNGNRRRQVFILIREITHCSTTHVIKSMFEFTWFIKSKTVLVQAFNLN